jgi:hypothetical protein
VHRRTAALVVLVAALALLLPSTVLAAGAALRGPADGVVTEAATLDVRVTREPYEAVTAIDLGLRRGAAPVEGSVAKRLCEGLRECPNAEGSADYRVPFDPRTGEPFLRPDDARILPNGAYSLQVSIVVGRDVEEHALDLLLSVPPSSPADVRAAASGQRVDLAWRRAPEPDVAGYRIERAGEGGRWEDRGQVAASTDAFVDEPGPGTHRYRVVSLRPDGRGGTYRAASREVGVTVEAPPADTAAGGDEVSGEGGGAAADGSGEDAPVDAPGPGADGDGGTDGDVAEADAPRRSGARSGDSGRARLVPSVDLDRGGADTPSLPWDDPDHYEETLAYGGPDREDPSADRDEDVLLSVPGLGSFGGGVDTERAAVPIAAGLLMTAVGLHLWRWLRVPLP